MKQAFIIYIGSLLCAAPMSSAADALAPAKSEAAAKPATKPSTKATPKPAPETSDSPSENPGERDQTTDANATGDNDTAASQTPDQKKPLAKSSTSKAMDGRLSVGTSVGWAAVKPAQGTWTGLGAADFGVRWRASTKPDGSLYYTGRYAPFAGVWTVNHRDYDTTLHGLYGGAEYHRPVRPMTLKAGVELGYMLVYARPQDKSPAAGDVKGGKVNVTAGAGADWGFFSDKVKLGPFARIHVAGFNMFHLGGSAQFVF
jgi:hypothetical protein